MSTYWISREVNTVKKKYCITDPFKLCESLGIIVRYEPMGISDGACKGFFFVHSRIKTVTINSDLTEENQRIICAHELGHAILHSKSAGVKAFHDFQLFDSTSAKEYEANIFAADLLMTDDDVLDALNDDISFFGAAARLNVPPELLDFKFRVMKRNGYKLIDPPILANGNFLKSLKQNGDDRYEN